MTDGSSPMDPGRPKPVRPTDRVEEMLRLTRSNALANAELAREVREAADRSDKRVHAVLRASRRIEKEIQVQCRRTKIASSITLLFVVIILLLVLKLQIVYRV